MTKHRQTKHRQKMRRVELMLDPASVEAANLDRLAKVHGSQAAAIKFLLRSV